MRVACDPRGVIFFLLICLLTACARPVPLMNPPEVVIVTIMPVLPSPTPFSPPTAVIPTAVPVEIQIGDSVPQHLRGQIGALEFPAGSKLTLDILPHPDPAVPNETQIQWVYVVAAPFATVRDGVTSEELRSVWMNGVSPALFNGSPLLMAESTLAAFKAVWGEPVSGSVRSVNDSQLLETAWAESAWAIIPFEVVSPRWKVLTVDGQSPIRKGFDASIYPLVVPFNLQASSNLQFPDLLSSNYDSSKLTTVVMTGVTALVRATAFKMEQKGIMYPGEGVRDLLREADIAHISNEIPFFSQCPSPDPNMARLVFCSDPKYIDLLTDIGTDVVEMTGNHFADYGWIAMEETISIYKAHDLPYFGGGLDLQDSFEPALFEVNGNRIAFLGCNMPDVDGPRVATGTRPGAAPCDFDYFTMKIAELKDAGYLVIFTFQWYEDYVASPSPDQMTGFRRVADAGATIVSGSQAHFPKIMEFYDGAFIHYGLGNLFFDQMGNFDWMPEGIRHEFLDRYIVYDGQLIGVELITALLEDFSRPRLMTDAERTEFLQEYFSRSGWTPVVETAGTSVP
jgi:hypothetical protein